ncbi:MAG: DUF1801 domain-containing protein [Phycisphaerales bacterium]|nr:DUF1801 domain-containing protein [Phycisphaerales bacterium]
MPSAKDNPVDVYMATLDHPHKADIEWARKLILGVDSRISEGIKWNAPSFRLDDDFATFHLRKADNIQIILHTGAKKRARPLSMTLEAPEGMVEWRGSDRCVVSLGSGKKARACGPTLKKLIAGWIGQLSDA